MSTSIDYVVDLDATQDEAPYLADRIVQELIRRGVILAKPQSHQLLGKGPEYAAGPNARLAGDYNDGFPCGLDVEVGRGVYTAGENGLDSLLCPACKRRVEPNDAEWSSAAEEWYEMKGPGLLACPLCGRSSPLTEWKFEPDWGFGNLAFKFSEWLLKEQFVKEIAHMLGHRVAHVKSHW